MAAAIPTQIGETGVPELHDGLHFDIPATLYVLLLPMCDQEAVLSLRSLLGMLTCQSHLMVMLPP